MNDQPASPRRERRRFAAFELAILALLAAGCSGLGAQPPTVEILSFDASDTENPRLLPERTDAVRPGNLVALVIPGQASPEGVQSLRLAGQEVATFEHDDAANETGDDRVVFLVPRLPPGLASLVVSVGGEELSTRVEILQIGEADAEPGALSRRFLDDLEAILTRAGEIARHPTVSRIGASASLRKVIFAVDVSGSMDQEDLGERRLAVAQRVIQDLLVALEGAARVLAEETNLEASLEIGLVSFAGRAWTNLTPGEDFERMRRNVASLVTSSGTAIGEGLKEAGEHLDPGGGVVILLSDGRDHSLPGQAQPLDVARALAGRGNVTVHTIGFGAPEQEEFDEELLRTVSDLTGGVYRSASSVEELKRDYFSSARDILAHNVVVASRDRALEGLEIARREIEVAAPPRAEVSAALARARAAFEEMTETQRRESDGILAASGIVDFTRYLRLRAESPADQFPTPGSPVVPPSTPGGLAACDGIAEEVMQILLPGAADLIRSHIPKPWGTAVASVIGHVLGRAIQDLWDHFDRVENYLAWGRRIQKAAAAEAACIDAIADTLDRVDLDHVE